MRRGSLVEDVCTTLRMKDPSWTGDHKTGINCDGMHNGESNCGFLQSESLPVVQRRGALAGFGGLQGVWGGRRVAPGGFRAAP